MKVNLRSSRKIGITLFILSGLLVLWLLLPYPRTMQEISFEPGEITFNSGLDSNNIPGQSHPVLAIPGGIHIILDWIPIIRKGGSQIVHFQVIQDEQLMSGNEINGTNNNTSDPVTQNSNSDYSIMLKTRLDMVNVIMDPPGESGSVLTEGNTAYFSWKITPQVSDDLQGTVWFYLVAFPHDGGEAIDKTVSAQNIDIKVISLLGLNVTLLWTAVVIISLIGVILFLEIKPLNNRKKVSSTGNIKSKR
jgi:hypothetical protein